jgi:lipopolysaccharide/colanic/teichoic acid biosynthesis glycosyltransferase
MSSCSERQVKTRALGPALKRCIDVTGSLVCLFLFAPVIAAAAALVLARMGRPVVFRQTRIGLNEKPFVLYKFRTMTNARGPDGELLPDGERLTSLGNALRRWSIDEVPQLWNVLRGEMSLVGPRPLLMTHLPRNSPEHRRRHLVRPGITGWAQVNGRNAITWEQKFELDVWYVDNLSMLVDLKIFLLTIRRVIGGRGLTQKARN